MAYDNEGKGMSNHHGFAQPDRQSVGERLFRITHGAGWLSQRQTDELLAGRKFRDAMDWIMWSEARKGEPSGTALRVQIRHGVKSHDCYYTQTRQYHITGGVSNAVDNLNGDLILRADGRLGWEDVIYREPYKSSPYLMDICRAAQLEKALLCDNINDNDDSVPQTGYPPSQQNTTRTPRENTQPSQSTSPASWDMVEYTPNTTPESNCWRDVKTYWDSAPLIPANEGIFKNDTWNWEVLCAPAYGSRHVC